MYKSKTLPICRRMIRAAIHATFEKYTKILLANIAATIERFSSGLRVQRIRLLPIEQIKQSNAMDTRSSFWQHNICSPKPTTIYCNRSQTYFRQWLVGSLWQLLETLHVHGSCFMVLCSLVLVYFINIIDGYLTHLGWDKMAAISRPHFEMHFVQLKLLFFIQISPKYVPCGQINNIPALVQIMAWRRSGDKPLSEQWWLSLMTHIFDTRPQWVYWHWGNHTIASIPAMQLEEIGVNVFHNLTNNICQKL